MATKKDKAASSAPKQTAESLSDDQLYSLTEDHKNKYLTLHKAKTDADTALKNFGRVVKADLGAQGLADIKGLIDLATPEGEARMKGEVERQVRLLRWMQVPIGTMGDMFADTDRTPLVERAFNEGKRQGLAGESCVNPHHHTVAAHKALNDGWAEGQKTKATKGFSKLEPDVASDIKKSASIGSSRPSFQVQ
jgi:ribosome modulation factor